MFWFLRSSTGIPIPGPRHDCVIFESVLHRTVLITNFSVYICLSFWKGKGYLVGAGDWYVLGQIHSYWRGKGHGRTWKWMNNIYWKRWFALLPLLQFGKQAMTLHPSPRLGEAEEVARVITWLASDQSSFINGVCMPIQCGPHATTWGCMSPPRPQWPYNTTISGRWMIHVHASF